MTTQTEETTGNFHEFRNELIASYKDAQKKWRYSLQNISHASNTVDKKKAISYSFTLFDEVERTEAELHDFECNHIERQLGRFLPNLICENLNQFRARCQIRLDDIFNAYEEDRKNGVPFAEREKSLRTREFLSLHLVVERGDVLPKDIIVRPTKDWLPVIKGYDRLKEFGVREYVNRNVWFMYELKK